MATSEAKEIKKQETLVRFSIISYKTRLRVLGIILFQFWKLVRNINIGSDVTSLPWYFTDLPQVKLYGKSHHNKNEKPRFYDDLMPNCEGLPNGWKFKIDHEFSLDASNKDEYYLHLNQNQVHISWLYLVWSKKETQTRPPSCT